ncbi:LEAF RUST 10 DISEASE-RESISTANCE LOCUS RECEPTOR-LIKE PROTEIN KINASE-like 2.4 [Carex rostrata]
MKFLNFVIVLFLFYNFGGSFSSSCGELGNLTYPYHLPGTCNWKAYEMYCEGNNTVFYIGATKYFVKDMSIKNKTFWLVDPDLAVGGLPNQTVSLDQYRHSFTPYSFSFIEIFIYFFNCTEEVDDSDNYKLIMNGPRSRVYAGVFNLVGSTPKSCRPVGSVLIDSNMVMVWDEIDGVEMMKMLRRGIMVSWDVDAVHQCSLLSYCWSSIFSQFVIINRYNELSIGEKLHQFLSFQSLFLQCTYQPPKFGSYSNSLVVFGFMVILLALLDILLVFLGLRLTLVPLTILSFLLHKYKRVSLSVNYVEKFLRKHEMFSVRRYDFVEISIMTNNFREKIGQGGFGSVYKGKLFNGRLVAVKMLTNSLGDGDDFISEVATIGNIHHANIVHLIGFCSEGSKRALVYPYMSKGSLDKYIFSSSYNSFTVEKRREIALGIARGIDYLHRGSQMQILHFDIKPHNILLDHDLIPKISDFGLAKLYSREYNQVTLSTARGTIGYIAPELISRAFGVVSFKADVYSFGMLLMEMASGRRNVNNHTESSSQVYYPSWIYNQLNLAEETHNYNSNNSVVQFGEIEGILYKVALWCIQMRASNRPSMSRVIEMLQSDPDSLEMPPRPFTTGSPQDVSVRFSQIDSCSIELSEISEEISLL